MQTGKELRRGWRWHKARGQFIADCKRADARCWLCGEPIDYNARRSPLAPELDHKLPCLTHPHLVYERSNWRVAHARCNQSRGTRDPAHNVAMRPAMGRWTPAAW